MSSLVAELQVLLEGVPLPASRQELLDRARREGAGPAELALLEGLPDREYSSLDEVGHPKLESGEPPGGSAYTDASEEPGWVRDRPD